MRTTQRGILTAAILFSLVFGFLLGHRTFTYYAFFIVEPMIFPCPYTRDINTIACSYNRNEPPPKLTVRWRGWPEQDGVPVFPPTSGNWLLDLLFFNPNDPLE